MFLSNQQKVEDAQALKIERYMILVTFFTDDFRKEFNESFTIYFPLYSNVMVLQENTFPILRKVIETFYVSPLNY